MIAFLIFLGAFLVLAVEFMFIMAVLFVKFIVMIFKMIILAPFVLIASIRRVLS